MADDSRRAALTTALGFLQLPVSEPELRLLHRWLDTWAGVGLITVGVERLGYRLSLSHIADDEWRAQFSAHPMWAPGGYGVADTPWRAAQRAGWTAVNRVHDGA
jgi:hypothetical protein